MVRVALVMAAMVAAAATYHFARAQQPQPSVAAAAASARPAAAQVSQIIVRYRDENPRTFGAQSGGDRTVELSARAGVRLAYARPSAMLTHVYSLPTFMEPAEALAIAKRIELSDPSVLYAEPDYIVTTQFEPNDPLFVDRQWHYKAPVSGNEGGANLTAAWDVTRGSAGVIVAIIDTGYSVHPDMPLLVPGYDMISDAAVARDGDGRDADPRDEGTWGSASDCSPDPGRNSNWHGSHVAGTIAALTNNGVGVAAVAPDVRLMHLRALGRCGRGVTSDVADSLVWAAGRQVPGLPLNTNIPKVINMSLGGGSCGTTIQDAINIARAAGITVVAATGNAGSKTGISAPASCQGVIAVTANTRQGDNATYAQVGPGTDISAPGGGSCHTADSSSFTCTTRDTTNLLRWVWSAVLHGITTPDSSNSAGTASGPAYAGFTGTSMATPHVAGVAALLLSRQPTMTPDEVESIIVGSAREHPAGLYCRTTPNANCGSGLLDATAALTRQDSRTPTLAITAAPAVTGGQQATMTAAGTARNGGSGSFGYGWTQTGGPAVTLANANAATASFTALNPGGTHTFRVTLRDGNGYVVEQTVNVKSNNAPTMVQPQAQSVQQGQNLSFAVAGNDPEGDALTYVAMGVPAGSAFSAASGLFTWNNVSAAAGTVTFTVSATDGTLTGNPVSVTINVTAPAVPPASGGGGGGALAPVLALGLLLAGLLRRRRG